MSFLFKFGSTFEDVRRDVPKVKRRSDRVRDLCGANTDVLEDGDREEDADEAGILQRTIHVNNAMQAKGPHNNNKPAPTQY